MMNNAGFGSLFRLFGFFGLGLVSLAAFFFSLRRPSAFAKKILAFLLIPLASYMIVFATALSGGFSNSDLGMMALVLSMPPLAALLMSLAGTRAVVDRCAPKLGIPLSILNAAGCIGLTLILFLPYWGGAFADVEVLYGGGVATAISLIYAFSAWKSRLAKQG